MGKGGLSPPRPPIVDLPGKQVPAVLLLAKPIEDAAIRKLAEKARGAVLLSDGTHAVLEAGAEPERELLHAAIGAEKRGPDLPGAGRSHRPEIWAAAVSPVVPGLWLWTFGGGAAAAHDAESDGPRHHRHHLVGGRRARHRGAGARAAARVRAGRAD